MKIFTDTDRVIKDNNTVLTIGTFDGFHVGHQKIIDRVMDDAAALKGRTFVITFEPHPRSIVSKDFNLKILTTLEEKISLLDSYGIENLMVINFTQEFSKLSAEEFFQKYIIDKLGITKIIIGHDHRLGRNRDGDENKINQLGKANSFEVASVPAVSIDGEVVSSTKVRNALSDGDITKVNKYLGRYYAFKGKVVKGKMRGRLLGFPTANIEIDHQQKQIPSNGIYVTEIIYNHNKYYGLMSVGVRPTFENDGLRTIEIFIMNFEQDIYGEALTINVLSRIRDELKFSSAGELIERMKIDQGIGLEIINKLNK